MPSDGSSGNRKDRRIAARRKRLGSKPPKFAVNPFIRVVRQMSQNEGVVTKILGGKFDWFLNQGGAKRNKPRPNRATRIAKRAYKAARLAAANPVT